MLREVNMHNLKENIKYLCYEKGITTAQLARATGIAPQTLNNWLSGQEPRNLNQLKKVSDYFSITLDKLCFGDASIKDDTFGQYAEEINAGTFEVILRKVKK